MSQAITTDAEGLIVGEVRIPVSDGSLPVYRARPAGTGTFPVVLVVQEIFGVHEHIQDVCRRFAKLGYLAIAPELYARQGDVSGMDDPKRILTEVVAKVPTAQVLADLDAAVEWSRTREAGDVQRLCITGFCWGGRIVWLYAAHNPQLKAGVAWYGRLEGARNELQPRQPCDVAKELMAPVLGLYGGQDSGIPLETVDRMRVALQDAPTTTDIEVYPEVPHGFFADYRPSYRVEAAEDGWARMLAWFARWGVA
ncbi:dienelactone hydrolase family protein [Vreelandella titanicae]|nr:dienelactone hydrolase family protein [Halomonas titanicae]